VGHDFAEPGRELVLCRAAELGEIAVGGEASVLYEVRIVEFGLQQAAGLESGQQAEVGPVELKELAPRDFVAAAGTHKELQRVGMAGVIGHRQFLIW
jgi:hypothetical protein